MAVVFNFDSSSADELLLRDSFSKLCSVVFPIEAARASVVMHYDAPNLEPTLIFLCNAAIHQRRVNPPPVLRVNGTPTRKYAVIDCSGFSEEEVSSVVNNLNGIGYYAYTSEVNDKIKLYVVWDERCTTSFEYGDEPEAGSSPMDYDYSGT